MSERNIHVVREMYEALNRGDWDSAHLAENFAWETDPRHPKPGIYRGREEFRRFLADLEEPFEQTITEPEEIFAEGDQVVAFVRIRRRPRGSAAEVEIRIGELYTIRDGVIVRGQGFGEREKALEAAGLRA